MAGQELVAAGKTGDLAFDGSFIEIRRTKSYAVTGFPKGVKRVPLSTVTALQWKPTGNLTLGYVQIVFAGSVEHRHSMTWDNRAKYDENTITFDQSQEPAMQRVRDAIEAAIANRSRAATSQGGSAPSDTRDCPYCAETIKAAAVVCRFCGRDVDPVTRTTDAVTGTTEAVPAAWHKDPYGRWDLRYWDGTRWTEHVSTGGNTSIDPPH